MNRTERLIDLVLEFQTHGVCSAESLAEKFNMNVRTIYRDIEVLRDAGISVVGMPGTGYKLPADFVPIPADILTNVNLEPPAWLQAINQRR
ncbi:MAG: HTH domain-containing protein [Anaerolineae bacterium]|nr:HTH domain-containing protein [Anaerolineae bacterium]